METRNCKHCDTEFKTNYPVVIRHPDGSVMWEGRKNLIFCDTCVNQRKGGMPIQRPTCPIFSGFSEVEHTTEEAHQEYIAEAEADHREAKTVIQDLRNRGLLSEADKAQREYLLIMNLNFLRVNGECCEHRSTLRAPVLKKDCPACQGEV